MKHVRYVQCAIIMIKAHFYFTVLETDSDSDAAPSNEGSFAFSQVKSRNSSNTSLESSASYDVTTGRKRALSYENTWAVPLVSASTASKLPKLAKNATPRADPGTPSRSSTASSSRMRAIQEGLDSPEPTTPHRPRALEQPESPTPYRIKVETPTMNRIMGSLAQFVELGA